MVDVNEFSSKFVLKAVSLLPLLTVLLPPLNPLLINSLETAGVCLLPVSFSRTFNPVICSV